MASLTAVSVQPVAVKGLAGSSISGRRLAAARPSRAGACRSARRPRGAAVVAKYGDKSVYFDLDDIGNTTGQWDLYGSDAPSPYNPLQVPTDSMRSRIEINFFLLQPRLLLHKLNFISAEQVLRDVRGAVHQEGPAAQVPAAGRRVAAGLRQRVGVAGPAADQDGAAAAAAAGAAWQDLSSVVPSPPSVSTSCLLVPPLAPDAMDRRPCCLLCC
ncbi:hypothetical protein PVAP13_3KG297827 [Panicum virgatum]|uniref:Photosystem I reaction center subunit VI n=1 Tax=Panicum virgatum TaxID=38727 RepID=A0A8T0UUJ8_PANVG|nr:hypothetical protein PVAP13_3KG297827 [Panicum virgatum]